MNPTVLYVGPLRERATIEAVVAEGDRAWIEVARLGESHVVELAPGAPARSIGRLTGHARRLVAVEDDALICVDGEELVAFGLRDRKRTKLHQLAGRPGAIAVTPEHAVWCTQRPDGGPGELRRWWRDSNHVDKLGYPGGVRVALCTRPPKLPLEPARVAKDIAIATDTRVGLIDAEGIEWFLHGRAEIHALAATAEALYFVEGASVVRFDLDDERAEHVALAKGPALDLAAIDDVAYVATNAAHDVEHTIAESFREVCVTACRRDRTTAPAGKIDDDLEPRTGMRIAVTGSGVFVAESGSTFGTRLVLLPADTTPTSWRTTLHVQRWLSDGTGGHLVATADGAWAFGAARGTMPANVAGAVADWATRHRVLANGGLPVAVARGWHIARADVRWHSAAGRPDDRVQRAIDELVELFAPHVPGFGELADC